MPSTACAVAEVLPVTLRGWRAKSWFSHAKTGRDVTLYSFIDLCVLRAASVLIGQGVAGNIAVPISDSLRQFFLNHKGVYFLAACFPPHAGSGAISRDTLRVVPLDFESPIGTVHPQRGEGGAALIINLTAIIGHVTTVLTDLGNPTVMDDRELEMMMARTFAAAMMPPEDEGTDDK